MENFINIAFKEQLKEVFEIDLCEGTYYFQKENVLLKSKINSFEIIKNYLGEEDLLDIELENGHISISAYSKIKKIKRIPNIILNFDWCFSIKNSYGEHIGYIGKPTE